MARSYLITGASSGLGQLMTEKLLARGDRVAATARRTAALDGLKERHGEALRVISLDVTDTAAVRSSVDDAFAAFGRIDAVVGNAGYGLFGAAEELGDEQIAEQVATNLLGSIALVRAALPHLRAQGGGRVMQVSSEGGQYAYPAFSAYHATKWGIEGFVESVAKEVGGFGIELTLVEPGPTGTGFAAALVRAEPMAVYADTPVGELRRALESGAWEPLGDAGRTVDAMIACLDAERAPRRLTLGSVAYESIRGALAERAAALEAQRETALGADRD